MLDSRLRGNDAVRTDEGRKASRVVPWPVYLVLRHTRGGGYPGRTISLEIMYLRA
jgi:hypothetical protein